MHISIKKTILTLSSITLFLIVTGWMTQYYAYLYKPLEFQTRDCHGFIRLFFLDGEANLPAWYQSMTLLVCAILLSLASKAELDASLSKWWKTLAVIFLLLSADEAACMHEAVGVLLSRRFNPGGFLNAYIWVIPGSISVLMFFFWSRTSLNKLRSGARRRFIVAGVVYVTGAIVWELAGAWCDKLYGARNILYMTMTIGEELFECAGVVLLIRAILLQLQSVPGMDRSPVSADNHSGETSVRFPKIVLQD